jgi:two-component system, cell cycle response regulator
VSLKQSKSRAKASIAAGIAIAVPCTDGAAGDCAPTIPEGPMRVLVADDDRPTTAMLAGVLRAWGLDVSVADDGLAAWRHLTSGEPPALAILDWTMPGLDGLTLCQRIRQTPALAGLYVLLLTARDGRSDLVAGLDAGADDYMVKPIDAEELRARVHVGMRVAALQQSLAARVEELQSASDHLARLVSTDALTDLCSRRWWFQLAAAEISRSDRYDRPLSLLVVDLDHFKNVNDTFGHDAGDALLRRFADMLRGECRQSDIIGRLGGEEFALLLPETGIAAARVLAERLTRACRAPGVPAHDDPVTCSCSIGVSEWRREDESIDRVLRRADAALYEAKRGGRDCWRCDSSIAAA